ncbi:DUF389 domain-containing protein [Oscillatoria sp. FACHB-1406]|uniref:DUF389 domain-containing protein n=1 Tax=Oscillatoria sp. FACHB-1406 TaxID=2692846 RepID=UPI0016878F90|nr:DUF389 domain-containing protein [Oscillatoria sp. FACHB-1406]MBD2579648.1 DUF389 domain-containing protein [Oscillatoria sp. FACHB-1406]
MQQQYLSQLRNLRRYLPRPVDREAGKQLESELLEDARWTINYEVLIVSSCAIATFGLVNNSAAVIIGAMLIAPLMLPLRALALGFLEGNWLLLRRATLSLVGGTLLAIGLSFLIGWLARIPPLGSEILSRTQPNLIDLGIAISAGGVSGFAKIRKDISDVLAGTAISVALMPPLCVVGLSISQGIVSYGSGAFLLYLTNLFGIVFACQLVFILAGYSRLSRSLLLTSFFTVLLLLPLSTNFIKLVRQQQLQATINQLLLRRTITLNQAGISLRGNQVDWTGKPPTVYLFIDFTPNARDAQMITSKQVAEVEKFISAQMQRPFTLVAIVNEVQKIQASYENSEAGKHRVDETPSRSIRTETLPGFVQPTEN